MSGPSQDSLGDLIGSELQVLYRHSNELYDRIDAVYGLHILGRLEGTNPLLLAESLASSFDGGWIGLSNSIGHLPEHATAYGLGAILLLDPEIASSLVPLHGLLDVLQESPRRFLQRCGFRFRQNLLVEKRVGWVHPWRSSHVGAGVPAALMMVNSLGLDWHRSELIDSWLAQYFIELERYRSSATGVYGSSLLRRLGHDPVSRISVGGAVHYFWIQEHYRRERLDLRGLAAAVLDLQQDSGLYDPPVPYCLDFDFNYVLTRGAACPKITDALVRNERKIGLELSLPSKRRSMSPHQLVGAMAAVAESSRLTGTTNWSAPTDVVPWL